MNEGSKNDRDWLDLFPELQQLNDSVWRAASQSVSHAVVPANTQVFREGDDCERYIFVIDGRTRVFKTFESGREIVLYRLRAGQTCSLTTSVLLAGGTYPATASTEIETHAVLMPKKEFHNAFAASAGFRDYVCEVFGGRIRDMIMLLEAVTFRRVDVRLAQWLLRQHARGEEVVASHRELAFELGTAREVISRQLKEFENQGWVTLGRKNITVSDTDGLEQLVHRLHA